MPTVIKLYDEFKDQGLEVLGIDNEELQKAVDYEKEAGLTFTSVHDPGAKITKQYRVESIPTTFIIDPKGDVVIFLLGVKTEPRLRAALRSVGIQ